MRPTRFPVIRRILILAGISCWFFVVAPKSFASADDHTNEAVAAAQAWVSQIDAGKYQASYDTADDALHQTVDPNKWVLVLQTLRTPLGEVVNRTQTSHVYKPNGYAGAEGEFMVITYDTSFKKLDTGIEVIVLKWDGGKWLAAGYTVGPKPSLNDDQTPQQPPTEMTTKTVHNPGQ